MSLYDAKPLELRADTVFIEMQGQSRYRLCRIYGFWIDVENEVL